jgi:putative tricarboxylic transport membrane protein
MGILGFILEGWGVPLGPVVLGIVLGEELEHRFIQCLTASDGAWWRFFAQPISALLALACLALWFGPTFVRLARRVVGRSGPARRVRSADREVVRTAE